MNPPLSWDDPDWLFQNWNSLMAAGIKVPPRIATTLASCAGLGPIPRTPLAGCALSCVAVLMAAKPFLKTNNKQGWIDSQRKPLCPQNK